jgi:hypothetical protein
MKLPFLTAVSLLANLALALLIWSNGSNAMILDPPSVSGSPVAVPLVVIEPTVSAPAITVPEPIPEPWPPFHWNGIASDNYTNYVANLRRIGCPEETIDFIVRGATWTDLMRRIHAGAVERHDLVYHLLANGKEGLERIEEAFKPIEEAEKERELLLATLFGSTTEAPPDDLEGVAYRRRAEGSFPYVDPARQALLAQIEEEWQAREAAAFTNSLSGRERSRIRLGLKETKRVAQMEVLSATERQEFERRDWAVKNREQFRTLSAVAASPEELRSLAGLSTEELAISLGPDRMADLKRISEIRETRSGALISPDSVEAPLNLTLHGSFQDLDQVARRFDLARSVSLKALDVLRSYETPLDHVSDEPGLLPRERRHLRQGLKAERDRQMEAIFGREAWETYQFHHGDW